VPASGDSEDDCGEQMECVLVGTVPEFFNKQWTNSQYVAVSTANLRDRVYPVLPVVLNFDVLSLYVHSMQMLYYCGMQTRC
jgi:hypothetical protein